jgi:hypothetical protein
MKAQAILHKRRIIEVGSHNDFKVLEELEGLGLLQRDSELRTWLR